MKKKLWEHDGDPVSKLTFSHLVCFDTVRVRLIMSNYVAKRVFPLLPSSLTLPYSGDGGK